jgi:hypothetical protein
MVHPGAAALVDLIPYTDRPYGDTLARDRELVTAGLNAITSRDAT